MEEFTLRFLDNLGNSSDFRSSLFGPETDVIVETAIKFELKKVIFQKLLVIINTIIPVLTPFVILFETIIPQNGSPDKF